jgi:hypothetical protein
MEVQAVGSFSPERKEFSVHELEQQVGGSTSRCAEPKVLAACLHMRKERKQGWEEVTIVHELSDSTEHAALLLLRVAL